MTNPCVYSEAEVRYGKECLMVVAVYVHDTILASNDDEMLKSEKARLYDRFGKGDQGRIHYCLGMSIKHDNETRVLTISLKT